MHFPCASRFWRAGAIFFTLAWLAAAQPEASHTLLEQGLLALDRGDFTAAAASLEKASRLQPKDPRIWLGLAQTYWKSGRAEPAQQAAARAAALAPDDPVILHGLAIYHSEAGDWSKAADFEARYAERAPADRKAYHRAASFYLEAGQPKPAIELTKKALALEDRADLHHLLGKAYWSGGQQEEAVAELQHAVRLSPYEEAYYFDLAHALLEQQDFDAAVRVLEAGLKIFEKSAQLELALGTAYYGQRRFADAVGAFLKTITIAPQIEQPYVFLGRILDQAGDRLAEITAKFAAFARSNPQNYLASFLWAKALIADLAPAGDRERAVQAEALLRKSIELNGQFWESHFELGALLERQRNYSQAAEELDRAARLNPKNSAVHYRLARLYDRLGRPDKAAAERTLHQKCEAEERATVEKAAGGMRALDPVIK